MESRVKILNALKFTSGTITLIGIIIFFLGLFENGYSVLTPIGVGTIVGAVFIFLMGMFLVASEEMVKKIGRQQ
ncbi:MAG: hypothetical protein ACQEXE_25935 [Bacillota bacterium]|jgi:hypothetical protein|uniref:Uncharacterized protein n=1 Tax=Cytobacillus oceanisediminis 2691 TaxID=1196031 RepID=A0A160MIC8_9BACI|nr:MULTISPECIES: hypothetical protein [Bacillaceae]AND42933.1 hypothetical protein A361_27545 [Cytobacillus oceanisediminis 2691]MBN8202735.1 hypothetical protein [Bacillus sp. NTK034]MCM3244695.1 hypothetical protein [Cytobacillus oceanisediminis]USK47452.1 hypothetical protein LIT27_28320 [Cytobacillus oceanisediminis]